MSSPDYRVGTASWTDPTLLAAGFYPPTCTNAEARLRFYSQHFNMVEIDATYYALPSERNAVLWAARTPSDFRFGVKAFAWLTQHQAEARALPRTIRDQLPSSHRRQPRLSAPSANARALAFEMFHAALEPLRAAGKLGCLLFQFPPWFTASNQNREYILRCRDWCKGDRLAVEFRHASWFGERREHTFEFLRTNELVYVSVDAPRAASIPPPLCVATGDTAYIRFHGRNRPAWFRGGATAAERFKYFYAESELCDWVTRVRRLRNVRTVYAVFNNCYADYGVANAATMRRLLESSAA